MRLRASVIFIMAAAVATFAGFTIVENTSTRLVVQWHADSIGLESMGSGERRVAVTPSNADIVRDGVQMPAYSFLVGVPQSGAARYVLTPGSIRTVSVQGKLAVDKNADPTEAVFSGAWLAGSTPHSMGRLRVQQITVSPVIPVGTSSCKVLMDAVITIEFPVVRMASHALPNTDYYKALAGLVVNFDTARAWAVPAGRPALSKRQTESPLATSRPLATFVIGDGHSGYNETSTSENGLVSISAADLQAVFGSTVRADRVALYGARKTELSTSIPPVGDIPDGVVRIPLLPIDKDHNGKLDGDDFVVAYTTGTSDWEYDTLVGRFTFSLHRYDDYRHYWLTVSTQAVPPIGKFEQPQGTAQSRNAFTDRVRVKGYTGLLSFPADGRKGTIDWVWQKLVPSRQSTATYQLNLDNVDTDAPGLAYVSKKSRPGSDGGISLLLNNTPLADTGDTYAIKGGGWENGAFQVRLNTPADTIEVNYLDITWQRNLEQSADEQMIVYTSDTVGLTRWNLSGLSQDGTTYVFRVPANETSMQLIDTIAPPANGRYSFTDSTGTGLRYCIASESSLRRVTNLTKWEPARQTVFSSDLGQYLLRNLRNVSNRADYLIVTPDEFLDEALRLAAHKKECHRFDYPKVARMEDVYREFSGGTVDPTALRNFLAYARFGWDRDGLAYVILMGSGHWDYKSILPQSRYPVFVPVYQVIEFNHEMCSDDYFAQLGSEFDDVFLGRIPCKTVVQAAAAVDKIIDSESASRADFGAWRNRMLLVADDDKQGPEADRIIHYTSSEKVADTVLAHRPSVEIRKVYLYEYAPNALYEKPAAGQAIINEINNGVAVVNYFGHGAGEVWADEHILLSGDINKMTNARRYPMINSMSCSVGKFDDPREVSLSENLVLAANAGAIATVSATREAWASDNERLALNFYSLLYAEDSDRTIGQAYLMARAKYYTIKTLRAYALLGDPSIRYVRRSHEVSMSVADAGDVTGESLDTIMALQQVTVTGKIKSVLTGSLDKNFGSVTKPAYVQLGLYNPPEISERKDGGTGSVNYMLPGNPLFSGKIRVNGGAFSQSILLPRNLTFDTKGVRLTAYAWKDSTMGLGIVEGLLFHGTKPGIVDDTVGPSISVRPVYDDPKQNSGATYTTTLKMAEPKPFQPLNISVLVYDESGVDVVGVGPNEGLTIEIPGVLEKCNINHTFQFLEGEFQQGNGSLVLQDGEIDPGEYQLRITAQDLLGNLSTRTIALSVTGSETLDLNHVFNYPNPMKMGESTRFYYLTPVRRMVYEGASRTSDDLDVSIKIFSLSGKLLRTFVNPENGVVWDGTDQFGTQLPPNVYLYQVTAWTHFGEIQEKTSPVMKLVIHPPRR